MSATTAYPHLREFLDHSDAAVLDVGCGLGQYEPEFFV